MNTAPRNALVVTNLLVATLAHAADARQPPRALTEETPGGAPRWLSLATNLPNGQKAAARLSPERVIEIGLASSPVLRLRGAFVAGCVPIVTRRFGRELRRLDVPLAVPTPVGRDLVVILPPALGPVPGAAETVEPAVVGLTLPSGCRPVDIEAFEAVEEADPFAPVTVMRELRSYLDAKLSRAELTDWLEATHAHVWQEQATLALALPRLFNGATVDVGAVRALAAGMLEHAAVPLRASTTAFDHTTDLVAPGPKRIIVGVEGEWIERNAGDELELDVTGKEMLRVDQRALLSDRSGARAAWRVRIAFDDEPPQYLLNHAPLDPAAPEVSLSRLRELVVPLGARRLRLQTDRPLLLQIKALTPKRFFTDLIGPHTTADMLRVAARAGGLVGALADGILHTRAAPTLDEGEPLPTTPVIPSALAVVMRAARTVDPQQKARWLRIATERLELASDRFEIAAASIIKRMITRQQAERAVADGNPGDAAAAFLARAAKTPLCDEDAIALLEADAFAEESLVGNPQAIHAIDGLVAHRPLSRALNTARHRAFRGATRWEELLAPRGVRLIDFLDPPPVPTTTGALERTLFVPMTPGAERPIRLPEAPLPHHMPILSFVTLRPPHGASVVRVRVDQESFTLPAVGPFERVDLPVAPGEHRVSIASDPGSTGVMVNWNLGAERGWRWRHYLEVNEAPIELDNRDVGPGDYLLVSVRTVAAPGTLPVAPFDLVIESDSMRPVVLHVDPGAAAPATTGDVDAAQLVTQPIEAVIASGTPNVAFRVSVKGPRPTAKVLVHLSARRRSPVFDPQVPAPSSRETLAKMVREGEGNLALVADLTSRLQVAGPDAGVFFARAAALAGLDELSLAREDVLAAISQRLCTPDQRRLAIALWRHLDNIASAEHPATTDERSAEARAPAFGFARTEAPPQRAALDNLVDDQQTLRTDELDRLAQRVPDAVPFAILAAARQAERDGDQKRSQELWHALAAIPAHAAASMRAGANSLEEPPDPLRDANAYVDLYQAAAANPHSLPTARALRQAAGRTRVRPLRDVDDSAGTQAITPTATDAFEQNVDGAMLPAVPGGPTDLLTRDRQLSLSFTLAAPMSLRLTARVRELRPRSRTAESQSKIEIAWSKDGEEIERLSCDDDDDHLCTSAPIDFEEGMHSLVVRLDGGVRAAARVGVEPLTCNRAACAGNLFERTREYLVARDTLPVVVTLYGPALVQTALLSPANGPMNEVIVATQASDGAADTPHRIGLSPGTEVAQSIVLPRQQTYRLELRPDRGEILCRIAVRDGLDASRTPPPWAATTSEGTAPPPLWSGPNVQQALTAHLDDGDIVPGWENLGALSLNLGWQRSADLTEDGGDTLPRTATTASVSYRRLIERLHLNAKAGLEVRDWRLGNNSESLRLDTYFMHPKLRWARVFGGLEGVTQSIDGTSAVALRGSAGIEPIATLRSGLHLVTKLGSRLQWQSWSRTDTVNPASVDPSVFSESAARHRRALFWEEDLEWEPLADFLIYGGARVTTNESFSVTHPDRISVAAVARAAFDRLVIESGYRSSWFLTGADRQQAFSRRVLSLALLHTLWFGTKHAVEIGVDLAEHIDLHIPAISLRIGWELSNGRRLQDHTAVEGENYFYPHRGPGRSWAQLAVPDR